MFRLHDQDVKLRKTNGKKRGGLATQIIDEKSMCSFKNFINNE